MKTFAERLALRLTAAAKGPDELELAHYAMRQAYPDLAELYPCTCITCTRDRRRFERRLQQERDA
jgi:hypothetical protein